MNAHFFLLVLTALSSLLSVAAQDCTSAPLNQADSELARFLFELRNNRQTTCSPPDFITNPEGEICASESCSKSISYGFQPTSLCKTAEPSPAPGVTSTLVQATIAFNDYCSGGKPTTLVIKARTWQCTGADLLLQPVIVETIEKKNMPADFTCTPLLSAAEEKKDTDFTPPWEFNHAIEAAIKYKLINEQPAAVPTCNAYMSTSMLKACYDDATSTFEGYAKVTYYCGDEEGAETEEQYYLKATNLGFKSCPWPEILEGSDGYKGNFTFTTGTPSAQSQGALPGTGGKTSTSSVVTPAPTPSLVGAVAPTPTSTISNTSGDAVGCIKAAGITLVDSNNPKALADASQVFNMRFTAQTALAVVSPTNTAQVVSAINCAREAGVKAVPRGGGHSYEGYSVQPGSITIDLKNMSTVQVSADKTSVKVGAGALLGQIYYTVATDTDGAKGFVGGTCPNVGIGGQLLGGGFGMLSRKYGLACDQLQSLTMVTHDGRVLTASATENTDLFWASCGGGGGNLGIVVDFTVGLVDVPAEVTIVRFTVPAADTEDFMKAWQEGDIDKADPGLEMSLVFSGGGELYGEYQYLGDAAAATTALSALEYQLTDTEVLPMSWIESVVAESYYESIQEPADLIDPAKLKTPRRYFKLKSFFADKPMSDSLLTYMAQWATDTVDLGTYIQITGLGSNSAVAAKASDATAFPHRDALLMVQYGGEWDNAELTDQVVAKIDELEAEIAKEYPGSGAYINYIDRDVKEPMQAYYGSNMGKMVQIKSVYDPESFFTYYGSVEAMNTSGMNNNNSSSTAPAMSPQGGTHSGVDNSKNETQTQSGANGLYSMHQMVVIALIAVLVSIALSAY